MDGSSPRALNAGDEIKQQQLIVTGVDGFAKFQVSDGSTFEVYPNSRVVFRETLGDWRHLLNVWLGRVKVFIQHAPGVANPNNVTSPTAVISVRGTVFDVIVDENDSTQVSVDEGEVAVRNLTAPGNSVILHPGDTITVIKGQPLVGRQIDKGNILRRGLEVARNTVYQVLVQRQTGVGPVAGGPGTTAPGGGANGDKGKPTGGTSGPSGTSGTAPAPPGTGQSGSGTAPPPPGGN